MKISTFSHRMPLSVVFQQLDGCLCDGVRIIERNNDSAPIGEKLSGMPVWCGDNCFSGTECDGKCAGNDLGFLAIWSDVDICSANVFDQFLGAHKTVVEDDVRGNSAFLS